MIKKMFFLKSVIFVFFLFMIIPKNVYPAIDKDTKDTEKSLSAFPILMYDTDIGVGYGGKAKFVNYLSGKESFDFILFNSTKGERWYVLTFALPDIEIRQGKKYPFSFDLRAEYDRYQKYSFYGIGADAREEDQTDFIFEKKELQLKFGRGISPHFVIDASYFFKNVNYYGIEEDKPFTETLQEVGEQFSPFVSLVVRYDRVMWLQNFWGIKMRVSNDSLWISENTCLSLVKRMCLPFVLLFKRFQAAKFLFLSTLFLEGALS